MKHLTDDQLSALLDDALPASERAACDAHLAGCDACRARLAEASALEESLGKALTHDPGEGYFADFAERVAKRIASGPRAPDAAPQVPKAPPSRSPWAWLMSPRGLALAGSTAALLITAGIAWMRFHNEQDVARALREASPRPAAPGVSNEAQPQAELPPAAAAPSAPSGDERKRTDAATPSRDLARMQEVRTLPGGEQVPVRRPQEEAGAPAAPATGSTLAQMKRRSVAPATETGAAATGAAADAKPEASPRPEAQQVGGKDAGVPPAPSPKLAAAPPAPVAQQAAPLAMDTARGQSFSAWGSTRSLSKSGTASAPKAGMREGLTATCGKVRDSRGRAIAGAQVTAVHDGVRTARTDADGAFCIEGLATGDTLTVMHVGFDPWTVVMTPMTSLAITLEPVGTLGPDATMLTGKPQSPAPSLGGAAGLHTHTTDSVVAPYVDVYADQSFGVRQLVRDAREATEVALREHTAPAFEHAAKQWATVARQVKGAPAYDAGFHYVYALRLAYQSEPSSERGGRLRSAMAAYLATTPATLPERATVQAWRAQLDAQPNR